jgi:hypothetical protein
MSTTGCSSSGVPLYGAFIPTPPEDAASQAPSDASEDGAPSDATAPSDAGGDSPSVVAHYGGFVPVDASDDRDESG